MTKKDLAESKQNLETAANTCMQTATDHEVSVKGRTEELKVIAEARKILEESTKGAESQSYSMFQFESFTSAHIQLRTRRDLANKEVVTMIQQLAKTQHSAALQQLASRISTVLRYGMSEGEDPFAKVKSLISDMIAKLQKEAEEDATEKAYCDEQMAKTEAKKTELDDDIAKLTSKIDKASADSATLKAEVKDLQAELATLAKEQRDMDKIRAETHSAFVEAKTDLEAGLKGVRSALQMLREYYGSAAFVQQPAVPV